MAHIARLRVYPVKGLDGTDREAAGLTAGGGLVGDREFALFDDRDEPINGKATERVHRLLTTYEPEQKRLTVEVAGDDHRSGQFHLDGDAEEAERWFADYFDRPVTIRRRSQQGFLDRPDAGPSVVSTATLEAVASWFDDLTVDGVRRRLRANVEIGDVSAFWEDTFVGRDAPAFVVGAPADGVRFEGVEPCGRCVVPTRDPDTGEPIPGFREEFIKRRAATFPSWADREAFTHDYTLMLIAQVPKADRDGTLRVGDEVTVVDRID